MKNKRLLKKAIYSFTIIASIVAGSITGYGAKSAESAEKYSPGEFYKNPYTSEIFYTGEKPATQGAEKFQDIPSGIWYYDYVDTLVKEAVFSGRTEDTFDPNGNLTVPECAALIVRCLGLDGLAGEEQASLSAEGNTKWYAGYMKVCIDAGIIDENIYGYGYSGKKFTLKDEKAVLKMVKRYELCAFLARMTTLDENEIRARNTYSEIGGLGHEFIRGGLYDMNAARKYRYEINDFESIPEEYREYVLMGYYNALFNGDAIGNFNPNNNLTRAEMSKLLAVLLDADKRFGNDYREGVYSATDADFRTDTDGKTVLKKEAGNKILVPLAEKLVYEGNNLKVSLDSVAPLGYTVEAHIYSGNGITFQKIDKIGPGSENMYENGASVFHALDNGKVIYLLRNMSDGGEIEGVLEANITNRQITTYDGIYLPEITN